MARTITEPTDSPRIGAATVVRRALTDEAWALIQAVLPPPARTGRPRRDPRTVFEGALWILRTGAPWRDLPRCFGPWQTVYGRYRNWIASGLLDRVLRRLLRVASSSKRLDLGLWCVDTTVVRASRAAGGAGRRRMVPREPAHHALGRSRGGFGTKLGLVCDGRALPLAVVVAPGQEHDTRSFSAVLNAALRVGRPSRLAGDKAYSVSWVRSWLRRLRIRPVIPSRRDQRREPDFDPIAYRGRNVIERLVGWLKESRRVATRYDKLAVTYLGFVKLAMIRRVVRLLEFSDTT